MLIITIGNIASGKSTYCNNMAKNGSVIVNDDAIVTLVHGGNYQLYNKDFNSLYKTIETSIITTALSAGVNVVIDRPNYKRSTRRRYIGLGHAFDREVQLVEFKWEEPEVHAKRRFESDNRGHTYEYWLRVAKLFQEERESIHIQEGYDQYLSHNFFSLEGCL